MGKWNVSNVINSTATNTIYNSTVTVDKEVKKLLFHTPLTQSFTCKEWGQANNLTATIKYLPEPHLPVNLPNPLVHTSMLKFDAFRTEKHTDKPQFRVRESSYT